MRFRYVSFIFFLLVFFGCFCFGSFVGTASAMEATSLPSEEMDLSDTGQSETSSTEIDTDSSSDASDPDSPVLYAIDSGADFDGLAYLDLSTSLGSIRLYLPYGVDLSSVSVTDGYVYNLSSSTLYFYCREFPSYTFSASRFSPVMYRTGSTSSTVELSGVSLVSSRDSLISILEYVSLFFLVLICFLLIRWWYN